MTKYDAMFEAILNDYENDNITFEQAEELNDLAYDKYVVEADLTKAEKKEKKREYKEQQAKKEFYSHGGGPQDVTRKQIEILDKSHSYLKKLANNRDDKSDKKIATAYRAIKNITHSPDDSTIEYKTPRDYTGKDNPLDEDFIKEKNAKYRLEVITYPHSDTDNKYKRKKSNDKKLIHRTKNDYEGDPRPSQYSFGHSGWDTTRLHPKRRIYGFAETDPAANKYQSYGPHKKVIDTKGKPIYKNAESSEGGFIEFD